MYTVRLAQIVVLFTILMGLAACTSAPISKQDAVDWYTNNASAVTWVGYQGTSDKYHYFIGKMSDNKWEIIKIRKNEMTVEDMRPFTSIYRYPLYYYLVDPNQDYMKIPGSEPDQSKH